MNEEFVQYLNRAVCIEDIVVLAYANIYKDFSASMLTKYKPDNHKEIQELISTYFELRAYNSDAINILKENLILLNTKKKFTFEDYYCIIETIDINYQYNQCVFTSSFNTFRTYSSLSKLYIDPYVFFIPKVKKSYINVFDKTLKDKEKNETKQKGNKKTGLRSIKPYERNNINAYLSNISLIHKEDILNRKLMVHEYNKNSNCDFCKQILDRKAIEIITVPLIHQEIKAVLDIEEDERYFWINGMCDEYESIILESYLNIIQKYKGSNVDFIIFPEMFLTENILKQIHEYLKLNGDNDEKMQIYILGTIWSDFSNKVVIMTSEGEYVFSQYKSVPFDLSTNKEEKLKQKEKPHKIHLMDFPEFARINTFICREIEDDALMLIPKRLESNIVFSPSFSPSLDMKTCPNHLASNYHCLTVISNACSARYSSKAVEEHKAIGFLCQPCKSGTESSVKAINYTFNERCKTCNNKCDGIKITINFGEIESDIEKTYSTKIE